MTLFPSRKKTFSWWKLVLRNWWKKPVKINWLSQRWLTNFAFYLFHPKKFVSISKKDSAMELSGAQEVCSNELSRIEKKLSENSVCVWITEKKLSHYVQQIFLFKKHHQLWWCWWENRWVWPSWKITFLRGWDGILYKADSDPDQDL